MPKWQEQVEALCDTWDCGFKFDVATECMWGGELRVTLTNPDNEPSRSIAFWTVGASGPEECALKLLADFEKWRKESE